MDLGWAGLGPVDKSDGWDWAGQGPVDKSDALGSALAGPGQAGPQTF